MKDDPFQIIDGATAGYLVFFMVLLLVVWDSVRLFVERTT